MQADVTTLDAKKAGTVELSDKVFGLEPRADILARIIGQKLAESLAQPVVIDTASASAAAESNAHEARRMRAGAFTSVSPRALAEISRDSRWRIAAYRARSLRRPAPERR